MKIRNGFISNSSSSSFIVKLPKPIEEYTLEEFRKLFNTSFDPINQLYNDLKTKGKEASELDLNRHERTSLKDNEYFVEYGNEVYEDDDLTYEQQELMENNFMPAVGVDTDFEIEIDMRSHH